MRKLDLTNQVFGRLRAIRMTGRDEGKQRRWDCICECGAIVNVRQCHLRSGMTVSCGCFQKELVRKLLTTHGATTKDGRFPEYAVYQKMIGRCYNPKQAYYGYYGARGITVCDRWLAGFQNFLDDMGRRPSDRHSIDRKNNDGHYEPGNCRWATPIEQASNTRRSRLLTHNGETHTMSEWSRRLGIVVASMSYRLQYWTPDDAFTRPVRHR